MSETFPGHVLLSTTPAPRQARTHTYRCVLMSWWWMKRKADQTSQPHCPGRMEQNMKFSKPVTCRTCPNFRDGTCMKDPPTVLPTGRSARPAVAAGDRCNHHPDAPTNVASLLDAIERSITSINYAMQERG